MSEKKDNWFGPCTLCNKDKQLTTVQLTLAHTYTLWLRRMCDDCRSKVLYHFYTGLGFKDTAKKFKQEKRK